MPFKVHVADQIYDTVNNYLIQPKTVGEGGYWTEFDWQLAAELGVRDHRPAFQRQLRLHRYDHVLADHPHGPARQ